MNVDRTIVTGEATQQYNCLAWSLGITSYWVWPWGSRNATNDEMTAFLRRYGYQVNYVGGQICSYGSPWQGIGHAARYGWESKCGSWLRLRHTLYEITGLYGSAQAFYNKSGARLTRTEEEGQDEHIEEQDNEMQPASQLSDEERQMLRQEVERTDESLRRKFDEAYGAWKATWSDPFLRMSSVPGDYARSQQFFNVVTLGPDILPLLMEKLSDPNEFFALQAVERLAPTELFITVELDDPQVLRGEQGRAHDVVTRWLSLKG